MTKKAYRKLIAGHLQWSLIGLIIALFVAFITSDHRTVVYGSQVSESAGSGVLEVPTPITSTAPASAPKESLESIVPDTLNGELVWPDPWDQIAEYPLRNY